MTSTCAQFNYKAAHEHVGVTHAQEIAKATKRAHAVSTCQQKKLVAAEHALLRACPDADVVPLQRYAKAYAQTFSARLLTFDIPSMPAGASAAHQLMAQQLVGNADDAPISREKMQAQLTGVLADDRLQSAMESHVWDDDTYRQTMDKAWATTALAAVYSSVDSDAQRALPGQHHPVAITGNNQYRQLTAFTLGFKDAFAATLEAALHTSESWQSNPLAQQRIFQMEKLLQQPPLISHQ